MIKVNQGSIEINGKEAHVVAEIMCLIKSFVTYSMIPKCGSLEKAREELDRMMDEVFESIERDGEEEEENEE